MNEKISVIVPVYNNEKYIGRCLKSICENTYKDLEIIVIDDGSSDQSGNICDEYAKKDFRIKVIHQKNQGVSNTRNLGISLSTGKYISFIDSDDTVPKNFYSELLTASKDQECDLCICSVLHIDNGCEKSFGLPNSFKIYISQNKSERKELWYKLNETYLLYGPYNKLYKAEVVIKNQIEFPIDISYGEDLLFNLKYLNYCSIIKYVSYPQYFYYTDNQNSLSHIYRENRFINGLHLNNCIKDFSKAYNLDSEKLSKYLARRIYDDAYNSLFDLFSNSCTLTLREKYKQIRFIMHNEQLSEALDRADIDDYSQFYTFLVRHKLAFLFLMINRMRNLFVKYGRIKNDK